MGFLWVTGFSFFHCVASPFHSFVTTMAEVVSAFAALTVAYRTFPRAKGYECQQLTHVCVYVQVHAGACSVSAAPMRGARRPTLTQRKLYL